MLLYGGTQIGGGTHGHTDTPYTLTKARVTLYG